MIKYIENKKQFEEEIKNNKVIVDFYAEWCGPCQLLAPILENIAKENDNVVVLKIDVDKNTELAREHGILSIPTIEIYKNSKLVDKKIGLLSKEEIEDLLR